MSPCSWRRCGRSVIGVPPTYPAWAPPRGMLVVPAFQFNQHLRQRGVQRAEPLPQLVRPAAPQLVPAEQDAVEADLDSVTVLLALRPFRLGQQRFVEPALQAHLQTTQQIVGQRNGPSIP